MFSIRLIVGRLTRTPTFEGRLIPSHGRKILPEPLHHLIALFDTGKAWWDDLGQFIDLVLFKGVVRSHEAFSTISQRWSGSTVQSRTCQSE